MEKRSKYKAAAIAGAVMTVLLLALLSGCARVKTVENRPAAGIEEPLYEWGKVTGKTISVWGRETDLTRGYMIRAFQRYEDLTGNTIRTMAIPPEEIEARVADALKDGGSGMDVLLYYGGTNIEAFDPDENFYDFSKADWVDDLTNVSINQAIYHGKVIGLPHWEASVSGTLYNKKIFKKLGITPPETQEEF